MASSGIPSSPDSGIHDDDVVFVEAVAKKVSELRKKSVRFLCDLEELIEAAVGGFFGRRKRYETAVRQGIMAHMKLLQSTLLTAKAADFDLSKDVDDGDEVALNKVCIIIINNNLNSLLINLITF